MDDYSDYEAECERCRKENRDLIRGFTRYLEDKGLSKKTVKKHVENMDFYINDFLLYYAPLRAAAGVNEVDEFLGSWFIRKALWASVTTVKDYMASLKHFYTYMNMIGQVSDTELAEMKREIKENRQEWIEAIRRYDDPSVDLEDVWG